MAADPIAVENSLWAAAARLWANAGLKPSEFSSPVLGLIRDEKLARAYAHVYEHYFGAGHSAYVAG